MGAFDGFRTLLNIRKERKLGPPGPKPRMGARIALHDVRIAVPAGLSDDMWQWMSKIGFREITVKHDRRRYRDVPPSKVLKLFDAAREHRRSVLKECIRESTSRPEQRARLKPASAA